MEAGVKRKEIPRMGSALEHSGDAPGEVDGNRHPKPFVPRMAGKPLYHASADMV